jgi:predicted CoA-binding protein
MVVKQLSNLTRIDCRAILIAGTPRGYTGRKVIQMESTTRAGLISEFVNCRVWAVVGASQDPAKYGYRVYRSLRDAGYTVYAVNPRGGELLGDMIYPTLADLPQMPEVVDTVVPPPVTEQIVQEMQALGLSRVWMQPGSESEAVIVYCQEQGIDVVYDACAMIHRRQWVY